MPCHIAIEGIPARQAIAIRRIKIKQKHNIFHPKERITANIKTNRTARNNNTAISIRNKIALFNNNYNRYYSKYKSY